MCIYIHIYIYVYWSVWFQCSGTPASTPFSHLLFGPFPVFGSSSVSLCFGAMGSCHRPTKGPTVDHRSWGITSRQHMALAVSLGYPWISKSIHVISILCHQGLFPKWWPQFRALAWLHPDLLHGRNSARRSNASRPSSAFGPRSLGSDGMRQ